MGAQETHQHVGGNRGTPSCTQCVRRPHIQGNTTEAEKDIGIFTFVSGRTRKKLMMTHGETSYEPEFLTQMSWYQGPGSVFK